MNSDPVFVGILQRRLKDFSIEREQYIWGYIEEHGYSELLNELRTMGYSYSIRQSTINKGKNAVTFSFKSSDPSDTYYFESPFKSLKRMTLQCILGPNHHQAKEESETSDHPTLQKKRMHITNTKKMGCPATILVRSVELFSEYEVDLNSSQDVKREVLRTLKCELDSASPPKGQIRYYLKVMGIHSHEPSISEMNERIHPMLVAEISSLANSGVTSPRDIEIYLRSFVEKVTENKPKFHNKAFYPSKDIIYAHVYRTLSKIRNAKCDQEALCQAIEKWKVDCDDDSFFFRPRTENTTLLFCHTTSWQKHMLERYGAICLLDATYRTVKYSLPLFFLAVKTNVGYTVVSTFVVQTETKDNIIEGLSIIKSWCPNWTPQFFMTDFSESEIGALERVFPGCTVYLCAFHREQAWQRWVKKSGNPEEERASILALWRAIADAPKEEEFQEKVSEFSSFTVNSPKVSNYFFSQWYPHAHRWATCFSAKDYITVINTNNGVEAQNKVLKYNYLQHSIDKTLTGMLKIVVEFYLPDSLLKYTKKNCILKLYNRQIPEYLHNRPQKFVKHMMARMGAAVSDVDVKHITQIADGIFSVQSSSDSTQLYCVNFDFATCTCKDFTKTRLLCKHFCAVIQHFPAYSFNRLPDFYINSPFLTLDPKFTSLISEPCLPSTSDSQSLTSVSQTFPCVSILKPSAEAQQTQLLQAQRQLREHSKHISDVSYLCTDLNSLNSCIEKMQAISLEITQNLPSSSGLPLLPEVVKGKSSVSHNYKPLPPRKKPKKIVLIDNVPL